jgi:NAD(P)-dependent dehydrogenase (short-subunit alcohol dehydrogenase family)
MRNSDSRGAPLRARATAAGWRLTTPALDVTSDDSVAAATGDILRETGGRLDVLVNNAGYYQFGALEETSPDELRAQLETNVVGVQRVTRAVLPAMRARRGGTVVTLGSVSGRVAVPLGGPYHASKWALEGMTESLAQEVAGFGIKVTLVEPGGFATDWAGASATFATPNPAYDALRSGGAGMSMPEPVGFGPAILDVVDADPAPLRVFFGQLPTQIVPSVYEQRLATWAEWTPVALKAEGK